MRTYQTTALDSGHARPKKLPVRALWPLLLCMTLFSQAQDLSKQLFDAHDTYKDSTFTHRRFKHRDIVPVLQTLGSPLSVSQIGMSLEGRSIHQIQAGTGTISVLLWSQMHGDEATATMALFDIFRFLQASGDEFDAFRQTILANTSLYFVPMLNPDGAERFQRRTSADIDMNRDALRLQSPESVLLRRLQQTLKPLVGFNLHDQGPRYSVGNTGKQAVVSFLATAYDPARSVNDVRKRSMQLIVGMNRTLQQFIPGQVCRYDDEFEPRAFGDNIQKWGTTLVLIESGGQVGDPEKMSIRRLNFVAMLTALHAIATKSYSEEKIADYQAIPENTRTLFDLLIRNATVIRKGKPYTIDLGINHHEVNTDSARAFFYRSTIDDLVTAGKVVYLGASNYAAYRLVDALWTAQSQHRAKFVSLQAQYSLDLQNWLSVRILSVLGLWIVFAILLYLRYRVHVRGRQLALWTIFAFAILDERLAVM